MAFLEVQNLCAGFQNKNETLQVLDRLSFTLERGKTLGIVGESGCGKSVTALCLMRLLPQPSGKITSGEITIDGIDITSLPPGGMLKIRGRKVAMIFQEPMTALNPVHRIGNQLMETYFTHFPTMSKATAYEKSLQMLKDVGIPAPEKRMNEYPHQLSGGMRQRVVIAIALCCEPDLLIADEPTTALDVTIQAQILDLIATLQQKNSMSVIFITHDLGVVAETCDEVAVMYAGRIVEKTNVHELFKTPRHPYTFSLLKSIPQLSGARKEELFTIPGQVPPLSELPEGCRFGPRSRIPHQESSYATRPEMREISSGHWVEYCPCCQAGFDQIKSPSFSSSGEIQ